MCGILFYYKKSHDISLRAFQKALHLQNHRGPDHEGIAYRLPTGCKTVSLMSPKRLKAGDNQASIAFGHKRLSIVDLSFASNQPVISENQCNVMLFNGEFYNYAEHVSSKYTAKSDTLTLFSLLEKYGLLSLAKVNGMWGLCYYNANQDKLFLARDRYGKKPVYYYQDDVQLIVSSEIKSIYALLGNPRRQVDPMGLAYYLLGKQTPFLNNGQTFYDGIRSVQPGQILSFDFQTFQMNEYAQINFESYASFPPKAIHSEEVFIKQLQHDVKKAINIRLKSEVPLTIAASGGVDSTWIASVASNNLKNQNNLSLYTCHIIDANDEVTEDLAYARALARKLKLSLHEVKVECNKIDDFIDTSRILTEQVELPLNLFLSTIPTYLMTKSMSEKGIKVVLDGVGGDEIMGGYPNYSPLILANANKLKISQAMSYFRMWQTFNKSTVRDNIQMIKSTLKAAITGTNLRSVPQQLEKIFGPYIHHAPLKQSFDALVLNYFDRHVMCSQTDVQLFEIKKYQLPYYLGIADQMSMINSVENRSPYLDPNLHKYIFMPERYKFKNGYNKYALRAAMPNNIADKYRWRQGKVGIGNAFSNSIIYESRVYECVMDSNFLRSFVDLDSFTKHKDTDSYNHLIRPLFSLAMLDDIYGLSH